MKETAFIALLLFGVFAFAQAQEADAQKKVKVQVEVTEDGETTTTTQEVEIKLDELDRQLEEMLEEIEMVLEEAMGDLEESDVEVIINRRLAEAESHFHPHVRHHVRAFSPSERMHHPHPKAFLGVVTESREGDGVLIRNVVEGSAAEKAGLQDGDVILEIDGEPMNSHEEVAKAVRSHESGDEISIRFEREGKKDKAKATLGTFEPRSQLRMMKGDDLEFYDIFLGPDDRPRRSREFFEEAPTPHRRMVYRFEMEELDSEEIESLNERSGASLDVDISLELERLMISPNPSDGVFVVDGIPANQGKVRIQVLNAQGQLVLEKEVDPGSEGILTRVDLTNQESGMYFLSIEQGGKENVSRIVKH